MTEFCESERKRLEKMNKFQLPNRFKKIGWVVVLIAFALMIAKKFIDEPSWVKPVLTNLMIVGFLLVSLSKEKIEDELIVKLRGQSYRLAFVFGVLYSLVQPYVEYGVEYLINAEEANISFSYFQVLLFMLVVQIMFFAQFKRIHG
jgi:hypothetical protein